MNYDFFIYDEEALMRVADPAGFDSDPILIRKFMLSFLDRLYISQQAYMLFQQRFFNSPDFNTLDTFLGH